MLQENKAKISTQQLLKTLGTPENASDIRVVVGMVTSDVLWKSPIPKATDPRPEPEPEPEPEPNDDDLDKYQKKNKQTVKKKQVKK